MTTLQVGGPARYFVRVENEFQIIEALEFARRENLDFFVLGGGSNVLISDKGFDGLVIQLAMCSLHVHRSSIEDGARAVGEYPRFTLGAGDDWDLFVQFCVEKDLAGVECLSGIPGTVGGTPVQNVGAYGQEVSETIVAVRCIDTVSLEPVRLVNAECGFSYRTSIFNANSKGRYIVYDVTFQLQLHGKPKIAYKDLVDHFAGRSPTLAETRNAVLSIRRSKSMVIDLDDPNRRSAGSFFKNPVVELSRYKEISENSVDPIPHFLAGDGFVKIPAAWLIEQAGFKKGFVMENAGISSNHTLAIINRGGASAAEIVALKNAIQSAVSSKFGIDLVPEPVFVGEF